MEGDYLGVVDRNWTSLIVRPRVRNALALLAIIVGVSVVSQPWTGFNSPDSEFYASLALFGSQVTDRAIEAAYTWTRLGYIVPVRGLAISLEGFGLDPLLAFEIWRLLLLGMIVGSVFTIVLLMGRTWQLAALLATFIGLNSMILAYLGNTYLSGTAIAVLFALVTLALSQMHSTSSSYAQPARLPRWSFALASGGLVGWLVMINPYAAILGIFLWISIRLVTLVWVPQQRLQALWRDLTFAALGGLVVSLTFLGTGHALFPGRSWIETYLTWNALLDFSDFVGDPMVWQRDPALLVVVTSLIASIAAVVARPRQIWAWAALAVTMSNIAATWILMSLMPGPWLEAPHYVVLLWPGALIGIVLAVTAWHPLAVEKSTGYHLSIVLGGIGGIAVTVWAGHFDQVLTPGQSWFIFLIVVGTIFVCTPLGRRRCNQAIAAVIIIGTIGIFVAAQLWQNGRGNLGIYGQYPFRSAFVDFNYREQMSAKLQLQDWLIARTSSEDKIALWTDVQRLGADAAAMQLWGYYNLLSTNSEMTREDERRLSQMKPTRLALYAPDRTAIESFVKSLPPWALPRQPECTNAPYLGVGTGRMWLCVVPLNVVG